MRNTKWTTIFRLLGLLAILALGAVQQPASAASSENQPCGGERGCWACVADDPDGGTCIVYYCDGFFWTNCFD